MTPGDVTAILDERTRRLARLRSSRVNPWPSLYRYYADNPAALIDDWGMTYDPRNPARGLPAYVPFVMFPKQRDLAAYILDRWRGHERGLVEKARDVGASWICVALASSICLYQTGITVLFGSSLERNVDLSGEPKSLFWKARVFVSCLPRELRRGWIPDDAPNMRILFRASGSQITGDSGDNIGRSGRSSIAFVDEAAHLARPRLVEASLSNTTDCRIDVSSPNGMNNPFAEHRHAGRIPVFTFRWTDDPRKDQSWYEAKKRDLDALTVAQEIDLSYTATSTAPLIPREWIMSAIDADQKLGLTLGDERVRVALDVADQGIDNNATAGRNGIVLEHVAEWSGLGSDIYETVEKAFGVCDDLESDDLLYDADGLGAGVRGDARKINEARGRNKIRVRPFRASGAVSNPDQPVPSADPNPKTWDRMDARLNGDYFYNAKAQWWFSLRMRFLRTHRAVLAGTIGDYNVRDLIVVRGSLPLLPRLINELAQPTYGKSDTTGKVMVNKQPDKQPSPNLADAVMIAYSEQIAAGYSNDDMRRALEGL